MLIVHPRKNFGILSKDNKKFLDYLTTTFVCELLIRNKIKIHIESGQVFHNNQITGESLYDFLRVQEDVTKVNIDINDNFQYYVREVLTRITTDRYDMNANSTCKFLFHHFNMLSQSQGKTVLQIRHSIIAEDNYALEKLQNKDWEYFAG